MKFVPHKYQQMAIDKILNTPRCGLFLDMGLGKTAITLTAVEELIYNSFEVSKVLVIAPLRVAEDTWTRECDKWEHLKILRFQRYSVHQDNADLHLHRTQTSMLSTVKMLCGLQMSSQVLVTVGCLIW